MSDNSPKCCVCDEEPETLDGRIGAIMFAEPRRVICVDCASSISQGFAECERAVLNDAERAKERPAWPGDRLRSALHPRAKMRDGIAGLRPPEGAA